MRLHNPLALKRQSGQRLRELASRQFIHELDTSLRVDLFDRQPIVHSGLGKNQLLKLKNGFGEKKLGI